MSRNYEDPISIRRSGIGASEEINTTHPAFAQISASRVSGGAYLYGSDFQHQHYVVIRVAASELNRHLSNDWPNAKLSPMIEIALSEAQYAAFISSMNVGQGVQCTLESFNYKQIPGLPPVESRIEQFRFEGREDAQDTLNMIDEVMKEIEDSKMTKEQKRQLAWKLGRIRDNSKEGLKFVLKQFGEHMETTVQKARTEISAYAHHLLVKTGIAKLTGDKNVHKVLGYEEREDD